MSRPVASVATQQKICTAVGIAIVKLMAVKKLLPSSGMLVANMWCTQSPKERNPVAMSDNTIASWPNIGRRAKVGMIAEMKPSAGMKMKYTSGWPKNQNMCCQRSTSPPSAGLKKCVPSILSSWTRFAPSITVGMAKMIMNAITSEAHTKSGIRRSDIPGARILRMTVAMSTATMSPIASVKFTSTFQKSARFPIPYSGPARGT